MGLRPPHPPRGRLKPRAFAASQAGSRPRAAATARTVTAALPCMSPKRSPCGQCSAQKPRTPLRPAGHRLRPCLGWSCGGKAPPSVTVASRRRRAFSAPCSILAPCVAHAPSPSGAACRWPGQRLRRPEAGSARRAVGAFCAHSRHGERKTIQPPTAVSRPIGSVSFPKRQFPRRCACGAV